jgi:hypothetical protein
MLRSVCYISLEEETRGGGGISSKRGNNSYSGWVGDELDYSVLHVRLHNKSNENLFVHVMCDLGCLGVTALNLD